MSRMGRDLALWIWGALLFLALAPAALAAGPLPLSSSWAPATVLGLTLIAAARQRH